MSLSRVFLEWILSQLLEKNTTRVLDDGMVKACGVLLDDSLVSQVEHVIVHHGSAAAIRLLRYSPPCFVTNNIIKYCYKVPMARILLLEVLDSRTDVPRQPDLAIHHLHKIADLLLRDETLFSCYSIRSEKHAMKQLLNAPHHSIVEVLSRRIFHPVDVYLQLLNQLSLQDLLQVLLQLARAPRPPIYEASVACAINLVDVLANMPEPCILDCLPGLVDKLEHIEEPTNLDKLLSRLCPQDVRERVGLRLLHNQFMSRNLLKMLVYVADDDDFAETIVHRYRQGQGHVDLAMLLTLPLGRLQHLDDIHLDLVRVLVGYNDKSEEDYDLVNEILYAVRTRPGITQYLFHEHQPLLRGRHSKYTTWYLADILLDLETTIDDRHRSGDKCHGL